MTRNFVSRDTLKLIAIVSLLSGCAATPQQSNDGGGIGGTGNVEDCSGTKTADSERCRKENEEILP